MPPSGLGAGLVRYWARDPFAQEAPASLPELLDGIARPSAQLGVTVEAPASLFGIAALDVPEDLVEVEATAVLD